MKLRVGVALVLGVAGAFAACGKSDEGGPPTTPEQGGEPAVAGGGGDAPLASSGVGGELEPASAAGAGGEPSSGGVPASGGVAGEPTVAVVGGAGGEIGEGGAAGSAGGEGGESGYVPITCGAGAPAVAAGLLNSKAFSNPMQFVGQAAVNAFNGSLWNVAGKLGEDGFAFAWGTTTYYDASAMMPSDGYGNLRMPSTGPLAAQHLCSAKSDARARGYDTLHNVHFRELSTLGACPAAAGTGSLSGCFQQTAAGAAVDCEANQIHIKGTVGTTNIDQRWFANFGAHDYSSTAVAITFGPGGLLDVELGDSGSGELIFPTDSSVLPGAVVCVGISKVTPSAGGHYVFTLDGLSSLGACPGTPVTGLIDACY